MLSEWLVDVPTDFASTYLTVPCPVGKRSLVVSGRGRTRCYTKSGYQVNQFSSLLPGGSRRNNNMGYALLDCIWSESNKTFYVIDVMCWFNQPVIECDTFFRFEWLKSRLDEEAVGINTISKYNTMRFERLPYYESSPEALSKLFGDGGQLPFSVELDGILFYNRETHYTHGPTPLVGWLKAYMIPEILGVSVAEKYAKERPAKYISLPKHIEYAKELKKEKKEKTGFLLCSYYRRILKVWSLANQELVLSENHRRPSCFSVLSNSYRQMEEVDNHANISPVICPLGVIPRINVEDSDLQNHMNSINMESRSS
ncbi:snurportin-1-like [Palaemon carinicauda]|uniref:snurportin-1-like n=1 Tax=Palaemon carinicauda TaxID=392227 RepID=UPI0035B58F71